MFRPCFLVYTAYEMSNARLDGSGYNRSQAERSGSAPGGRSVVSENPNDYLSDQRGFDETASFGGYSTGHAYNNYSQAPQGQAHSQYAYR